jgi:acid phosphatase family membrane protein YuiD
LLLLTTPHSSVRPPNFARQAKAGLKIQVKFRRGPASAAEIFAFSDRGGVPSSSPAYVIALLAAFAVFAEITISH